jgi:hypothetical protein
MDCEHKCWQQTPYRRKFSSSLASAGTGLSDLVEHWFVAVRLRASVSMLIGLWFLKSCIVTNSTRTQL